jgi:hypothetical protein
MNEANLRIEEKLRTLLGNTRYVTLCLDGWTKKGYSLSYLGISACFWDPQQRLAIHALLNLHTIHHPHTGQAIAQAIEKSLQHWNIPREKILLIITDNGANMLKAVQCMNSQDVEQVDFDPRSINPEDVNEETDDEETIINILPEPNEVEQTGFKHLSCLSHSLQLIAKKVYGDKSHYATVVKKARNIVTHIRKSSVLVQKLLLVSGKTLLTDCITRWNSTLMLLQRLVELKHFINDLMSETGADSLLTSEWVKLDEVITILLPFKVYTDVLQSNAMSLSNIIPSLLDLKYHLETCHCNTSLRNLLLQDFLNRFDIILDPMNEKFNPLPSVACLLDPTVAMILLNAEMRDLLEAAKHHVIIMVSI